MSKKMKPNETTPVGNTESPPHSKLANPPWKPATTIPTKDGRSLPKRCRICNKMFSVTCHYMLCSNIMRICIFEYNTGVMAAFCKKCCKERAECTGKFLCLCFVLMLLFAGFAK